MRTPYMALLALSGVAAAFLVHLGVHTIDIVVSVYTLIYWATAPFARPLPKPVGYIHTAVGVVLLAAFSYFAALRIAALLRP